MKPQLLLLSLILLMGFSLSAQQQRYSKVKILLDETHTLAELAALGLETDHGFQRPNHSFTGEFSETEITTIKAAGFATEMLIPDLKAYLLEQNKLGASVMSRSIPPCGNLDADGVTTPANYTYGTMAGYYKYQEMLDILDSMAAKYPNLFKSRAPLHPTLTTYEGRPLYWVKISDNPNTDEGNEPEIFFNALHHAREPNSMSQMIFFMWYLLENYETDPEVKFFVDNSEIYFVPCVNPDGYIYNETTNPDGGGYWRKNRRPNADGSYGVDLNRNYGYNWAFDDTGSSGDGGSETYRGNAPFSEPETQMIRQFCIDHEFAMTFSFHTSGNLLLYSWDYDYVYTPDDATFVQFSTYMTEENGYTHGTSGNVLYLVNGGSNDYMYGEQTEKNKILGFVPEVGYSFWPLQEDIDRLNKDAFEIDIKALRLLHNYGRLKPSYNKYAHNLNGIIGYTIQKFGLSAGNLTVTLTPLSNNATSVSAPKTFNLATLETANDIFYYTLDPQIQDGDSIRFEIKVDNGIMASSQNILIIFANTNPVFNDAGDDINNWEDGTLWDATDEAYISAPSSITDSKNTYYSPDVTNSLILNEPIHITNADNALLSFWAKWDTEQDYDYAQVEVSFDGQNYTALCGKYTQAGQIDPVIDQPIYTGYKPDWVFEEIDLSPYLPQADSFNMTLRFSMTADATFESDGFYFDDLKVTVIEKGVSAVTTLDEAKFKVTSTPNPAEDLMRFAIVSNPSNNQILDFEVINAYGQSVKKFQGNGKTATLDVSDWTSGVYYYRVSINGKLLGSNRFVVGHQTH